MDTRGGLLSGRVALVTGASSGLGERFARVLRDAGANVVMTARREERLKQLAGELDSIAMAGDIASADTGRRWWRLWQLASADWTS